MITVVAALIEMNGAYLVGQRRRTDRHPLKWEFPGGKVKPGESPAIALARELREELGIVAVVGPERIRYSYSYGGKPPITLIFHQITAYSLELCCYAFEEIRWVLASEMTHLDFLEGDLDLIRRLQTNDLP